MLPIWPSGAARLHNGILEITTGDGVRIAVRDITDIGAEPPRAGRLSLRLAYRAGLSRAKTSYWVQPEHEAALHRLVDAIMAQKEQG